MSTLRRPPTHANSAPKPACRAVLNPRQHTTDSPRQAESRAAKPLKTRAIRPAVPVVFQNNDLLVTAFLIDHRPVEVALGFRFDYRGRSVVISGDTLPTESLRRHAEGADLLLHEALQPDMLRGLSHAANISGRDVVVNVSTDILTYHTFPEEAARIAQDANVGHLVLHHILPPMPAAILHPVFLGDSRKYYRGPITIGADGMLFSLPAGSTKVQRRWLL